MRAVSYSGWFPVIHDARFYRRKCDAARTLEAVSANLRDETDLDALSDNLVGVVGETMQPTYVSFCGCASIRALSGAGESSRSELVRLGPACNSSFEAHLWRLVVQSGAEAQPVFRT